MNKSPKRFLLIMLLAVGMSVYTFGQVDLGSVAGTVVDAGGSALPGAEVVISGSSIMGGKLSTTTDVLGKFRFSRVPIGTYVLEVKLQGFKTNRMEQVAIAINSKVDLNIKLQVAPLNQDLTVIAEAPLMDQVKPNFNVVLDAKTLDVLPINRGGDATNLANFNPGDLRYEATLGSGWFANAWIVDGSDVRDPVGGDVWYRPNYEIVEEVEFVYGGANAEYSDFTGALVKMVTRGGSNRFTFSTGITYSSRHTTDTNTTENVGTHIVYDNNYDVNLGGPLIKDKIWFYVTAALKPTKTFYDASQATDTYVTHLYTGKFTISLNPNHRTSINYNYQYNKASDWNSSSPYYAPSTWYGMLFYDNYLAVNHTSFFGKNTIVDLAFSWHPSKYNYTPKSFDPIYYDDVTGYVTGGCGWYGAQDQSGVVASAKVSRFVENLLGAHEFKAGADYRYSYRGSLTQYTGNMQIDDYGYMKQAYIIYPYYMRQDMQQFGGFFQDDWTIGKRLTVSVGLRYDHARGIIPDQHEPDGTVVAGRGALVSFSSWSPRIGANLELTKDGKTMFRANFGRYYQMPSAGAISSLNSFQPTYSYADWTGTDWEIFYTGHTLPGNASPKIKDFYQDKLSLSLEREIFKNATLSINFLKNWTGNFFGRVPLSAYRGIQVYDSYGNQTVTVYRQTGSYMGWLLTTIPESYHLYMKYYAFQIIFNKRLANRWYLNMSYHYEHNRSNVDNGYGDLYTGYMHYGITVSPNNFINADGYPTYFRPHQFKMIGSYQAPWGILASVFGSYMSGNTYNRVAYVYIPGWTTVAFHAEQRGSHHYPAQLNIDFMLRKTFNFKKHSQLDIELYGTNILNANTVVGRYNYTGDYYAADYYGQISSIVAPRRATITARFRFN